MERDTSGRGGDTGTRRHGDAATRGRGLRLYVLALLALAGPAWAAERAVDPTFLRRNVSSVAVQDSELSSPACTYKPLFGVGDSGSRIARGVVRFGEARVTGGGACKETSYAGEEQVYFVLDGSGVLAYGNEKAPVRMGDFMYLAPGVPHAMSGACRFLVMGWRVPAAERPAPGKLQIANLADVPKQTVAGHPPTTLYQLMMGDKKSTRDKIAAGEVLTSLFVMEFAPGGTNFPHHHEREEEIYLVLDGAGDMVAGSGMDGVEGRFPAKPGDAYFFRLNCTVGFYNGKAPGHILAVRSLFPFGRR